MAGPVGDGTVGNDISMIAWCENERKRESMEEEKVLVLLVQQLHD